MLNFNTQTNYGKGSYILYQVQFALAVFGFLNNILVICVFSRKNMRKYTYSFYCRIKACSDLVLLLYVFRNWSAFFMESNLDTVNQFFCIVNSVATHLCSMFSLGILMVISLDRLLAVMYPNRFPWLKKLWFQCIVAVLAFIYSLGLNIVLPVNTQYSVRQFGSFTFRSCLVPSGISSIHSWIRNINILVIILIINNIFNFKLIAYIVSSRRKVANNSQTRSASKDKKMMVSAIGLGFTALVCKFPLGTLNIIDDYIRIPGDLSQLISNTFITLLLIEYSAMFVVNMTLNSMFYHELLRMLGFRRQDLGSTTTNTRPNTIQNINNSSIA